MPAAVPAVPAAVPAGPATVGTAVPTAPLHVLVADDEQDIRELVCLAVRRAGATTVTGVSDGAAALEAARSLRPDLVVLDVAMPGITGLAVCAALRDHPSTASTAVLLLSAAASLEDVARGLAAGADAYLAKPFAVAGLVHQVRALTGPGAVAGNPAA